MVEFPDRNHDRKAPAGKFRLLGVDTFEGPSADFLVGDFNDKSEARSGHEASLRNDPFLRLRRYWEVAICSRRLTMKRKRFAKCAQIAIFKRDGWLCQWCKRPVIFGPAMKLLAVDTGGPAYYHAHWTRDTAPLPDELGAVLDHKECFSKNPDLDSEENLVTACNKCNGRKSAATLDQFEKRHKRTPIRGKYGEPQRWDGMTSAFVTLANRCPEALTPGEKEWLDAIVESSECGKAEPLFENVVQTPISYS